MDNKSINDKEKFKKEIDSKIAKKEKAVEDGKLIKK